MYGEMRLPIGAGLTGLALATAVGGDSTGDTTTAAAAAAAAAGAAEPTAPCVNIRSPTDEPTFDARLDQWGGRPCKNLIACAVVCRARRFRVGVLSRYKK